jgi:predicted DNA-binding protein (MmcQ/YjbR family)
MPEGESLARAETALRDLAMTYPDATEEFPWGHRAIKVRRKMFVILGINDGELFVTVKLPDSHPYALLQQYAKPTEYGLGKHGWVTCRFRDGDELPTDLLEEWVEESYRAVAPKKLVLVLNARQAGDPESAAMPTKKPAAKKAPGAKTRAKKRRK